jgi:hypothetical protein
MVAAIIRDNHITVAAANLSALALDEKVIIVNAHAQVDAQEVADPIIMIAAKKVSFDSARAAFLQRMENVEIRLGNGGRILEVEVKNIAKQKERALRGDLLDERDEAGASLPLTWGPPLAKMGIGEEKHLRGPDLKIVFHRVNYWVVTAPKGAEAMALHLLSASAGKGNLFYQFSTGFSVLERAVMRGTHSPENRIRKGGRDRHETD